MEDLDSKLVSNSQRIRLAPVPLYAHISGRSNSNFHTFHLGGQDIVLSEEGSRLEVNKEQSNVDENSNLERRWNKFVQGWLFFEVLRAVLGRLPGFDITKFTREDQDNTIWVTTKDLPDYLEQWLNYEMENPEGSVPRLLQAQLVLDKARHYVFEYCSVLPDEKRPSWTIDDNLVLSIMVLGEILSSALAKIQRKTKFYLRGWSDHDYSRQGWGYSQMVLDAFRQKPPWCPKAVTMLKGVMRNSSIGLLYALNMRPEERIGIKHKNCTDTECRATVGGSPVELENPQPFHCCREFDREKCKEVGPNTQKLAQIIDNGQIPILQYQSGAEEVDVIEMNASYNKEYVIFSHVWIDGFGNRKTNMMNQCVLEMFRSTFAAVKRENVFQQDRGHVEVSENFWIDTLAIPIGEDYADQRRKAIRSMHEIYKNAKYTVVLDFGLMSARKGEGYLQPAMRITLSNWMTRLWTLQEAFLSKNLYFKFLDQVYSMDRLERLFQKEDEPLHSVLPSLCRTYYHGILEKESRNMHGPESTSKELVTTSNFVSTVWKAVQWRTTAHRQHETLSLATLLHVNTDAFADSTIREYDRTELNERMQELLDLLAASNPCAIPPGIIFGPGPRLRKQGYRWAPESWLAGHPVDSPDPGTIQDRKARLNTPHGLEVFYPGFRLHNLMDEGSLMNEDDVMNEDNRNEDNLRTDLSKFYFTIDRSLWQWYRISSADKDVSRRRRIRNKFRDLAIIAPQLQASGAKEIGLLVEIAREQSSILFVEILHRIYINAESEPKVIQGLRAKFLEPDFGFLLCGERLSPEQHWCVDGRDDSEPAGSSMTDEDGKMKRPGRSQTVPIRKIHKRLTNIWGKKAEK